MRSLRQIGTATVVCGPSKTVDHILKLNNYSEAISDFVEVGLGNDISIFGSPGNNDNKLVLAPAPEPTEEKIYFTPRVGLHLTKRNASKQLQMEFVYRDFRALIQLPSVWKARHLIVISMFAQGMSAPQISIISGTPLETVNKFIAHYKTGYAQADITDYFYRRLSDPEVCACYASIKAIQEAEQKRNEKKVAEEADKQLPLEEAESNSQNEIDLQVVQEIEQRELEKRLDQNTKEDAKSESGPTDNEKEENETESVVENAEEAAPTLEEDDYEEFTDEE